MTGIKSKKISKIIMDRITSRIRRLINNKRRFTPYQKQFLGSKIYIHDFASFLLGYEELFESQMYRFNSSTSYPYIIDCGANLGMSVIYFKQLYPGSEILAIEADSYIFGFLEKNVKSFQFENVKLLNKAAWIANETLEFSAEGGAGGRIGHNEGVPSIKVEGVRLRDFLIDRKVDFLKLDIEGAEYQVLLDCRDSLKSVQYMFIEYHSFANEKQNLDTILNIISQAGFRYHIKEAYTSDFPFIQVMKNNGMDLQLNIFCIRI